MSSAQSAQGSTIRSSVETQAAPTAGNGNILLVDDEDSVRLALKRILTRAGYRVMDTSRAADVVARLGPDEIDVVVSDINMPQMGGVELLRAIHAYDPDLPVVLVTGLPTVETAQEAVELGALRYLSKPVDHRDLEAAIREAMRARTKSERVRHGLSLLAKADLEAAAEQALGDVFDRALRALWMAFQPIVSPSERRAVGYEALMRSDEPEMPHPGALLDAAERLDRILDLGRIIRAAVAGRISELPAEVSVFVNLHPEELNDEDLYDPRAPLSAHAARVVLEITERAAIDKKTDITGRLAALKQLGYRIAVDDLGAGYASLSALASLHPDIVKIDMSLVRDVDTDTAKRMLTRAIIGVARELGITVVAEGVETPAERDTLTAAHCTLFQGFFFARPSRQVSAINWD